MTETRHTLIDRPLSWSLIGLWAMCCIFIIVVVVLGITIMQRVDTITAEQARRTGVITEVQSLRDELTRLRSIQMEKTVMVEQNRMMIQVNTLELARIQKRLDVQEVQMQELKFVKRSGAPPASPTPDAEPHPDVDGVPRSP